MKTVFIINPCAGQKKNIEAFVKSVKSAIVKTGSDASFYVTQSVGDAKEYVREFCSVNGAARFIACGGDGTLSEVLNGAIDYPDAEIGVIPMGTGNDFCRNFSFECDFNNICYQMLGDTVKCDAIKYTTVVGGVSAQGYCINMFNIGFDCNVADMTADMKKKPFVAGSLAYFLSILIALIKKKGTNLQIIVDGEQCHNGKLLLTSLANGCYCGGGIKSNPLASLLDGMININIIKDVTRRKFVSLLPHYMKGTFPELPGIDKYILSKKCRRVTIIPNSESIRLCIDGEIINAGKTEFEIVHGAFNFVVPKQKTKAKDSLTVAMH